MASPLHFHSQKKFILLPHLHTPIEGKQGNPFNFGLLEHLQFLFFFSSSQSGIEGVGHGDRLSVTIPKSQLLTDVLSILQEVIPFMQLDSDSSISMKSSVKSMVNVESGSGISLGGGGRGGKKR